MPRQVWTQSEIEKAVPLRYEGLSPTQVAKILTTDHLKGMDLPAEVFDALEKINQERKRDTRMYTVLEQMLTVPSVLEHVTGGELRDAIVMAHRLMKMETTDRWKLYYAEYEKAQQADWSEKVKDGAV